MTDNTSRTRWLDFDWKAASERASELEAPECKDLMREFYRLLASGKPFVITNGAEVVMRYPGGDDGEGA